MGWGQEYFGYGYERLGVDQKKLTVAEHAAKSRAMAPKVSELLKSGQVKANVLPYMSVGGHPGHPVGPTSGCRVFLKVGDQALGHKMVPIGDLSMARQLPEVVARALEALARTSNKAASFVSKNFGGVARGIKCIPVFAIANVVGMAADAKASRDPKHVDRMAQEVLRGNFGPLWSPAFLEVGRRVYERVMEHKNRRPEA